MAPEQVPIEGGVDGNPEPFSHRQEVGIGTESFIGIRLPDYKSDDLENTPISRRSKSVVFQAHNPAE
ncbi:MAG: hypothetical protein CMN03_06960 [Roseibacillus sp.]|nr:hypothetical protein [Roseibacillus sp.]